MSFYTEFLLRVLESQTNRFVDTVDPYSLRIRRADWVVTAKARLYGALSALNFHHFARSRPFHGRLADLTPHWGGLARAYDLLADDRSKALFLDVLTYRVMGPRHMRLPLYDRLLNMDWASIDLMKDECDYIDSAWPNGTPSRLCRYDLRQLKSPLTVYGADIDIFTQFVVDQYHYSAAGVHIGAAAGDVALDCGACHGLSSLAFADSVGAAGKVYAFEFVPENLKLFRRNLALNKPFNERVAVIEKAIWQESRSDLPMLVQGAGSMLLEGAGELEGQAHQTTEATSLDDFVANGSLGAVDFIKMDIEGAELPALKGARQTLQRFKPKLAIAVYHSTLDMHRIAVYLDDLHLGYEFHLGHYTATDWESILYARVPSLPASTTVPR